MQNSEINRLFVQLFSGKKGLLHILFWTSHLLIRTLFSKYHSGYIWENFIVEITELPVKIIIGYFGIYLIERYISRAKLGFFILGLTSNFFLGWFLKRVHDLLITMPLYIENGYSKTFEFWNFADGVYRLIYIYPTVSGIIALTFTIEWFHNQKRNQKLEILNKKNELRYLKSQIQPHFLFNTLNNLYSLSLDKADETPEVILQLSELLSFMLYQADKPTIPIRDEIDLIHSLFRLESLRSSQPVNFEFNKEIQDPDRVIPPLLLFPIAENAFKYGIGDDEGGSTIIFKLTQVEHHIEFTVQNQIKKEVKTDRKTKQGLGLDTLSKRLEILFPNQYELKNYKLDNKYFSTLKLWGI